MTAAATVLALTPMIGGLISSTLLTLLLVPVLYTALEARRERRNGRRAPAPERTLEPVPA